MCEWALRDGQEKVLEPSAGDGNFLAALNDAAGDKGGVRVTAVEIDRGEIAKARARSADMSKIEVTWRNEDFFTAYQKLPRDFDAVVGNPPFIRFQHFDADSREIAFDHLRKHGYRPTKLANAWAAFVQLSIELLRPGGRLAMVIPAELLQVKYAAELRERITQMFDHVVLVTFQKLVFEGIQQEVVLLLAEGKRTSAGEHSVVHTVEFADAESLFSVTSLSEVIAHSPEKHAREDVKWTALFLPDAAFSSLEQAYRNKGVQKLGDLARVEVGIVTGRNSFFVIDDEKASNVRLNGFSQPLVGRTSSLRSICFNKNDFAAHSEKHPSILIDLNGVADEELSGELVNYIQQAEREGVHKGYKCSIRKRWYDVPSIYVPDAFLFRQIHDAPLLVANKARVTSTDTIHRVRFHREIAAQTVAAAFCNSLTFAWAKVCGRSYGGGLLELEPREALELPIPLKAADAIDEKKLDRILRKDGLEAALDYSDPILLGDGLGMSAAEVHAVRKCWVQLRDRRKNRKHTSKLTVSKVAATTT